MTNLQHNTDNERDIQKQIADFDKDIRLICGETLIKKWEALVAAIRGGGS